LEKVWYETEEAPSLEEDSILEQIEKGLRGEPLEDYKQNDTGIEDKPEEVTE
jgi:hypothetical protein